MDNNIFFSQKSVGLVDRRIKAFADGYRQNLAILSNDKDQLSFLFNKYFSNVSVDGLHYIYSKATYINGFDFFKNISFSVLSSSNSEAVTVDSLILENEETLPSTVKFIKRKLKDPNSITFMNVLDLINKFIDESEKHCVFVVEDIVALKNLFKNFHQDFSKFIMFQKKCMIIISGVDRDDTQKILSSDLNFLFGNFEKINISERSFIDNYLYFQGLIRSFEPTSFLISFFVNIIGSHLSYYHLIADYLNRHDATSENSLITETIFNCLYKHQTYFYQKFNNNISLLQEKFKDHDVFIKILRAISQGYIRKSEIVGLNIAKPLVTAAKIQKLVDIGFLRQYGQVYRINDDLFSFWLSHVFSFQISFVAHNGIMRENMFRRKIEETIELFKDEFFKDRIKRILELIADFKDDSLKIGKKRMRLPKIDKTKVIFYPERKINFLIGEGKKVIFMGIKEDLADDNDIIEYIDKTNALKGKYIRKFFITLDQFTPAAKIIAKENNLVAWDINEINDLFRIYKKPVMVSDNLVKNKLA